MTGQIKIGISSCLLGNRVRYDGGHKLDLFIRDTLGAFVEYVPVCPEAECGLGIPREAMRLEGDIDDPRLVTVNTKIDITARMKEWARMRVTELEKEGLCGFIFKSRSPSSGMEKVEVYNKEGVPLLKGTGLFANEFMTKFLAMPVEDEVRLHDPDLRKDFLGRVLTLKRWRDMVGGKKPATLPAGFHTENKLLSF
ncbi:MAG: DUF523 domain-containing protein [Deltaproteobacteria bacterium]|nr:DUF523 domain-containing protein [Deltaproteobacteria bacterium]